MVTGPILKRYHFDSANSLKVVLTAYQEICRRTGIKQGRSVVLILRIVDQRLKPILRLGYDLFVVALTHRFLEVLVPVVLGLLSRTTGAKKKMTTRENTQ